MASTLLESTLLESTLLESTRSTFEEQKQQVAVYLGCDVSKLSDMSRYELDVFLKHIEDDKKNGTIRGRSPERHNEMTRTMAIPLEERLKALDLKTCKILSGYLKRGIKAMAVPKVKVSLETMLVGLTPLASKPVRIDNSCW